MKAQPVEWLERVEQLRATCVDLAAVIGALALARLHEHNLGSLSQRQDEQLRDALLDFAFRARKLIETTRRAGCLSADRVHDPSLIASPASGDSVVGPEPLSLVDVLGRMIHSNHFEIERASLPLSDDTTTAGSSGWAFTVASDRDRHGGGHIVFVEPLLRAFMDFDSALLLDLRLLRKWAAAG